MKEPNWEELDKIAPNIYFETEKKQDSEGTGSWMITFKIFTVDLKGKECTVMQGVPCE